MTTSFPSPPPLPPPPHYLEAIGQIRCSGQMESKALSHTPRDTNILRMVVLIKDAIHTGLDLMKEVVVVVKVYTERGVPLRRNHSI